MMSNKSISLDHFYIDIKKHILLAQTFIDQPSLNFIIQSCRLKPRLMMENKNMSLILHKEWIDEWGNNLYIAKNTNVAKRVKILYNDLSINRNNLTNTDIYYGLSINKISKISKLIFINFGIDEDTYDQFYLISFLGLDNYLRTYMLYNNRWEQVSPLLLGERNLRILYSKNETFKKNGLIFYKEKKLKTKFLPLPCLKAQQWLTSLPVSIDFMQFLENNHKIISEILK